MYGKAIKCDVCKSIKFVNEWTDVHSDIGVNGWIRIAVNDPLQYHWAPEGKTVDKRESIDACSLSCARDYLRDVENSIFLEEK